MAIRVLGRCAAEIIDLGNDDEFVLRVQELGGAIAKEVEWALGVTVEELQQFETEYGLANTTTSVVTIAELQAQYGGYFTFGDRHAC
jgi:hypothetical protein|eukprot:COSAG02_NODE_3047_length_7477_cov_15.840201_6_plen_87_part_00